ncbi:MAG: hypothetical protein DRR19_27725 [Candidatus Parabeggiatoa sp. nov. 1]|nr:MAG: hypothetical protein DRR19_27725 [Gammaproteobacteria bacterium]
MHLSNSCPKREIIICDPFSQDSFEKVDPVLDKPFSYEQFSDTKEKNVRDLFVKRNRKCLVVPGYFPNSLLEKDISPVSFVHLDVDTYQATRECLDYLMNCEFILKKSLIVVDDYNRMAEGVNKTVSEIVLPRQDWFVVPMFPSQALLIPIHWYVPR